ncbi:MAG: cytidine deaminase, partial [Dactylosporangium sp.]|nr:cytidine deaminase [Dactylosporangium sp.]NNJ63116.1 cytidine deaminase [Dactylosporangium sp.]
AGEAMKRAYAPYSDFPVGAAGLVDDGRIVVGCNVENASYGLGLCAECGMISSLHVGGGGRLVAVSCVDGRGNPLMPCGRCRQLLWEHGGADCLFDSPAGPTPMADVLPFAFDAHDLINAARSPDTASAVPARLAGYAGRGTVFVHPDILGGNQVWTAYWERSSGAPGEQTGILEEAPTWTDVATAVRWGRARTPRVVVVDGSGSTAWAGAGERPADVDRVWAP